MSGEHRETDRPRRWPTMFTIARKTFTWTVWLALFGLAVLIALNFH